MSTSDRRSGSSGSSGTRKSVYISTTQRDRQSKKAQKDAARPAPGGARRRAPDAEPASPARLRAEQRKAERESRRAEKRSRSRFRSVAIVVAILAIVAACGGIYSSSLFSITRVEVVGVSHLTADHVRAIAAIPSDATLLRFPADAVSARVAADPWVAAVSVSRVFPNGMRIRVTERVPVATVDTGKGSWLLDAQAVLITTTTVEASSSLPVITAVPELTVKAGPTTSPELQNAVAVLTGLSPQLALTVRSVSAPNVGGTAVLTADRVEIVIGQAVDMPTKDKLARRILTDQRGRVVSIDVRNIDRPTWRGVK